MLSKTLSHMWDKLNLPMLLFKVGLLTLIKMDSFIFVAKFSVIHTLSHRAKTVCSKPKLLQQEMDHLRKALTKCKYPKWFWTRWRKDLTCLPVRSLMGLITKALQLPKLSPVKSKLRVTLSYSTHKVFVKVSKRSVVDMAFKHTSKVAGPSKTFWSPPRTKTLWSTKVVPYIGTNVVT